MEEQEFKKIRPGTKLVNWTGRIFVKLNRNVPFGTQDYVVDVSNGIISFYKDIVCLKVAEDESESVIDTTNEGRDMSKGISLEEFIKLPAGTEFVSTYNKNEYIKLEEEANRGIKRAVVNKATGAIWHFSSLSLQVKEEEKTRDTKTIRAYEARQLAKQAERRHESMEDIYGRVRYEADNEESDRDYIIYPSLTHEQKKKLMSLGYKLEDEEDSRRTKISWGE